jgi:hypothetical protein
VKTNTSLIASLAPLAVPVGSMVSENRLCSRRVSSLLLQIGGTTSRARIARCSPPTSSSLRTKSVSRRSSSAQHGGARSGSIASLAFARSVEWLARAIRENLQRLAAAYLVLGAYRATQGYHHQNQRAHDTDRQHGPLPFRLDEPQDDHAE